MEALRHWVSMDRIRNYISAADLQVILNELDNVEVGIRASNRFTITYKMLWNVSEII